MSFKMPIAWLVRAINSSYLSMPSTLKRKHKPALGEGQKPVDNYVDTSPNGRSYPQAGGLGAIDKLICGGTWPPGIFWWGAAECGAQVLERAPAAQL